MVAELIAEEGALKGLILTLEEGEEWIIGRDPTQCDLVIEDPKTSRRHLLCRKIDDGYVVENLSEEPPTFVNGLPLGEETLLHENDQILIGETLFTFYPEGVPISGVSFQKDREPSEPLPPFPPREEEAKEETPEPEAEPEHEEATPPPEEAPPPPEEEVEEEFEEPEVPFEEAEIPEVQVDLTQVTRFMLKVIAGPNTGAEFALDLDRKYLMGTDTVTCDIVFNDLSVSREHARMTIGADGLVTIEDLESRNGVVVNRKQITAPTQLGSNAIVALGTSSFLLIDREAPAETISTPIFEAPPPEVETRKEEREAEEVTAAAKKAPARPLISSGTLVLGLIIAGLAVLFAIGMVSLFKTTEIEKVHPDYLSEIDKIVSQYPGVRSTYNKTTGQLFLVGHVRNGVEQNELIYKLRTLPFIKGIQDNVVNDEAVWQEMNILLSKHSDFKGVSMHAPQPGLFVLSGYLRTEQQAVDLSDYMNVHFNYLDRLQNRVIVEHQVSEEVATRLLQQGYGAVNVAFLNGELQLTGYINATQAYEFDELAKKFTDIPGVRKVKNFVVAVTPEQGVIDLNRRYPGRYRVTGYSQHGDVNVNVVINGKILTRGDVIDGMTVTSIQPHTIFLEKDGLKYKIEYNK